MEKKENRTELPWKPRPVLQDCNSSTADDSYQQEKLLHVHTTVYLDNLTAHIT